jgi:ribonucleotide reductase beta subunit family protein with ferritin-like domain
MSDIQLNDPQTLYRSWEDSQWSPFDVDLSHDRKKWPALKLIGVPLETVFG